MTIKPEEIICISQRKIANSDAVDLTQPRNNISEVFFLEGKSYNYFGLILEDEIRPDDVKVKAETAIPVGIYRLSITMSPRFKRHMVLLTPTFEYNPKKEFDGLRVHGGNSEDDTEGCLIVAKSYDPNKKRVFGTMEKEFKDKVMTYLLKIDNCYIKIENKQLTSNDELNRKLLQ